MTLTFGTSHPYYTVSNWRLAGWSGPCVAAGDACTVKLDRDVTVMATIEPHPRLIVQVSVGEEGAGRGSLKAGRQADQYYRYDYMVPRTEWGVFILELGESLTLNPTAEPGSHLGAWTGHCAAAGQGPCKLIATTDGTVSVSVMFDPDLDPRYRLAALVPLTTARQMRGGHIAGATDSLAAGYDVRTGRILKPFGAGMSWATSVNRRGDLAGITDNKPFVAYADGRTAVLDTVEGQPFGGEVVSLDDGGWLLVAFRNGKFGVLVPR